MTIAEPLPPKTRRQRRWVAPLVVMIVVAAGIGVGLAVAKSNDRDGVSSATQIANVQQACQDWMSRAPTVDASGDWCRNMGSWMNGQLADGHMGGSMMWGDRSRMLETCRQWADTEPASTTNGRSCDDMVSWMNDHMGADWDNWTMRSSMMGR